MGSGGGNDNRRRLFIILIILVVVFLVVGGVAAFALTQLGGGGGAVEETPEGEVALVPTPSTTVDIIVAAQDIPRGKRMTVQDVTIFPWPDSPDTPLPTGALLVGEGEQALGLEQVDGRIARTDILTNQPILDFMITPGDQPTDLVNEGSDAALLVPSGQIAIAVPVDQFSSIGYGLREGDQVDILMSWQFVDVDEEFQTLLPNNAVVLAGETESTLSGQNVIVGREEPGPFGTTLFLFPSEDQRPRQSTQLIIDQATVLRIGQFPLSDINQPIVVEAAPPAAEEAQAETPPENADGEVEPTPAPTPIPAPQMMVLVMPRQDALVLKYARETNAKIDYALRSAVDAEITDITTDTVTLEYILNFYGLDVPPPLPVQHEPPISPLGSGTDQGGAVEGEGGG